MNWQYSSNMVSDGSPGAYLLDLFTEGKWAYYKLPFMAYYPDFTGGMTMLRYW